MIRRQFLRLLGLVGLTGGIASIPTALARALSAPVLSASVVGGTVTLTWTDAGDEDNYRVLRGTSPTGLTAGTLYFVIATGLTTDAFRVSTTQGGAALDITGNGSAIWRKVVVTNFSSAGTFQVAAGDLDIFATE